MSAPYREALERVSAVRGVQGSMLVSATDGLVVAEQLMEDVDGRAVAALAAAAPAETPRGPVLAENFERDLNASLHALFGR